MGSKEGIMHISMTFLNPGDEVLVPNPGYPTYSAATALAGGKVRTYTLKPENNWLPNIQGLESGDLSKVKIMWINYPHMPTGSVAPLDCLSALVAFARRHKILLVNDNPYAFILTDSQLSLLAAPDAPEVALELTSLSKAHNMAGWRVGVLAGAETYLQSVLRFKSNMDSGMFRPLQEAAVVALQLGAEWYDNLNAVYRKRRLIAYEILDCLDCAYTQDQVGLFVWAKCPSNTNGYQFCDNALYEHQVFISPGGIFGNAGREYVRISLCNSEDILREALRRLRIKGQPSNPTQSKKE